MVFMRRFRLLLVQWRMWRINVGRIGVFSTHPAQQFWQPALSQAITHLEHSPLNTETRKAFKRVVDVSMSIPRFNSIPRCSEQRLGFMQLFFKGTVSREFQPLFIQDSNSSASFIHMLKYAA